MQEEEFDEHNVQISPPGFHVIYLPYADDFRKVKFEEQPKGTLHVFRQKLKLFAPSIKDLIFGQSICLCTFLWLKGNS